MSIEIARSIVCTSAREARITRLKCQLERHRTLQPRAGSDTAGMRRGSAGLVMNRKRLIFLVKLVFSVAVAGLIYGKVLSREGGAELWGHLADIKWGWVVASGVMQ